MVGYPPPLPPKGKGKSPQRLFPKDNSGLFTGLPEETGNGQSAGLFGGLSWDRDAPPPRTSSFSPVQGQSQKSLLQDLHSLQLLPQELEQNTEYEFQVRSKPASSYQGTWSDWSPLASLKTAHQGEPPHPPLPSRRVVGTGSPGTPS